jgi:hypothetical protein
MEINNLSTNGFALSNVFDSVLLNDLFNLCETFTPAYIRPIVRLNDDQVREVYPMQQNDNLRLRILDVVIPLIKTVTQSPQIRGMELWRDFPGYNNPYHYDDPIVQNIMMIYLGNEELDIGTGYEEGDHFTVRYKKNTGLILLNSDKIYHGMISSVPSGIIRKSLYINWLNDKT